MKIEASRVRIADVVRLPLRGEAEVVRRDESGREVRLWFRGSEDDPLPSVVLDQQTIVDVQRPGSLLETVEQGDRRELIQRMKQALQPGGWSFHEATEQEPDHFHDAGDLVRVELRGNRVVLVTRRREGEAWVWQVQGSELGTVESFAADLRNQVAKLETTSLLLHWEREGETPKPNPAGSVVVPKAAQKSSEASEPPESASEPAKRVALRVRYSFNEGVLICGDTKPVKDVIHDLRVPYRFEYSHNLPEGCAWYVPRTRGTYQPRALIEAVVDQLRVRGVRAHSDIHDDAITVMGTRARDPSYPKEAAQRLEVLRTRLAREGWTYHTARPGTRMQSINDPSDTVRIAFDGRGFTIESRMSGGELVKGWTHCDLFFGDLYIDRDFEGAIQALVAFAASEADRRTVDERSSLARITDKSASIPAGAVPVVIHYSRERGVVLCGPTYDHKDTIKQLSVPYRFKFSRKLGKDCHWFVAGTRGTFEPRSRIDNLAAVMTARGVPVVVEYVDPNAVAAIPASTSTAATSTAALPATALLDEIAKRHNLYTPYPKRPQLEAALVDAARGGILADMRRWLSSNGRAEPELTTTLVARARGFVAMEAGTWPPAPERGSRYEQHEYLGMLESLAADPVVARTLALAQRWPSELERLAGADGPKLYYRSDIMFHRLVPDTLQQRIDAAQRASFYGRGRKQPALPDTLAKVRQEVVERIGQLEQVMHATLDPVLYDRATKPSEVVDRLCKYSTAFAVSVLGILRELPVQDSRRLDAVCSGATTIETVVAEGYREKAKEYEGELVEAEQRRRDARALLEVAQALPKPPPDAFAAFNAEYRRLHPEVTERERLQWVSRARPEYPQHGSHVFVRGPLHDSPFRIGLENPLADERGALGEVIATLHAVDEVDYYRELFESWDAKASAAEAAASDGHRETRNSGQQRERVVVPVPPPVVPPPRVEPPRVEPPRVEPVESDEARLLTIVASFPTLKSSVRPELRVCQDAIGVAELQGLGRAMRTWLVQHDKLDAQLGARLLGRVRSSFALESGTWPPTPERGAAFSDFEFAGLLDGLASAPEIAPVLAAAKTWRADLQAIDPQLDMIGFYRNKELDQQAARAFSTKVDDQIEIARARRKRGEPSTVETAAAAREVIAARMRHVGEMITRSLDARLYDPGADEQWVAAQLCAVDPAVAKAVLEQLHRIPFTTSDDPRLLCSGATSIAGLHAQAREAAVDYAERIVEQTGKAVEDAKFLLGVFEAAGEDPTIKRFNLAYWRRLPQTGKYTREALRLRASHFARSRNVEGVGPAGTRTNLLVRGPGERVFIVDGDSGSEAELLETLRVHLQEVASGRRVAAAQADLERALREQSGESADATAVDVPAVDESEGDDEEASERPGVPGRKPDRKRQADRLRQLAIKLARDAEQTIAAPRQENTRRRAGIAAGIRGRAYGDQVIAKALMLAADEVERGELTYIARLSSRAQIQDLETSLSLARYDHQRATRTTEEKREPILEDVPHARYRGFSIYRNRLVKLLAESEGKIDARLRKKLRELAEGADEVVEFGSSKIEVLRDVIQRLRARKHKLSWDAKEIADELARIDRYARLGIRDTPTLQAALREYLGCCREHLKAGKEDPIAKRKRELQFAKIPGYFPTPRPLAEQVVAAAGIEAGMRVLEPSAGSGSLAEVIRERHPDAELDVVEFNFSLRELLRDLGFALHPTNDFMSLDPADARWDRIVMNPPFEDRRDAEHIAHALDLLAPGGRVVAIASGSLPTRSDKGTVALRERLAALGGTITALPEGSFASSGTGASTVLIVASLPAVKVAKRPALAVVPAPVVELEREPVAAKPACKPCAAAAARGLPKPDECPCKHDDAARVAKLLADANDVDESAARAQREVERSPFRDSHEQQVVVYRRRASTLRRLAELGHSHDAPLLARIESRHDVEMLDARLEQAEQIRRHEQGLTSNRKTASTPSLADLDFVVFAPLKVSPDGLRAIRRNAGVSPEIKDARKQVTAMIELGVSFVPREAEAAAIETLLGRGGSSLGYVGQSTNEAIAEGRLYRRLGIVDEASLREALRQYLVYGLGVADSPRVATPEPAQPARARKAPKAVPVSTDRAASLNRQADELEQRARAAIEAAPANERELVTRREAETFTRAASLRRVAELGTSPAAPALSLIERTEDLELLDRSLARATRLALTRAGLRLLPNAELPPTTLEHLAHAKLERSMISPVEVGWMLEHGSKATSATKHARAQLRELSMRTMSFVPGPKQVEWLEAVLATTPTEPEPNRIILNIRRALAEVHSLERLEVHDDASLRAVLRQYLVHVRGVGPAVMLPPITGFEPTSPQLAARLVELAEIKAGMRVLEPMAGAGTLAAAIRDRHPSAHLHVIERNRQLNAALEDQGFETVGWDFGGFQTRKPYDRIVFHPPTEDAIRFSVFARQLLALDGRMVVALGEDFMTRNDQAAVDLRATVQAVGGRIERGPGATVLIMPGLAAPQIKVEPHRDARGKIVARPSWVTDSMSAEDIAAIEALNTYKTKWEAFAPTRRSAGDPPWAPLGATGCMQPVVGDDTLTVCVPGQYRPAAVGACPPLPERVTSARKLALCEPDEPVEWFGGPAFREEVSAEVRNRLARRAAKVRPISLDAVHELPAFDDFEGQARLLRQLVPTAIVVKRDKPLMPIKVSLVAPHARGPEQTLRKLDLHKPNERLLEGESLVATVDVHGPVELVEFVRGLGERWQVYLGPIAEHTIRALSAKLRTNREDLTLADYKHGRFADESVYWVERDGAVLVEPINAHGTAIGSAAAKAFAAAKYREPTIELPEGWAPDDTVAIAGNVAGQPTWLVWQPGNGAYSKRVGESGEWSKPVMHEGVDMAEQVHLNLESALEQGDGRTRFRVAGPWLGQLFPSDYETGVSFESPSGGAIDLKALETEYASRIQLEQRTEDKDERAELRKWTGQAKRRLEWAKRWLAQQGKPPRRKKAASEPEKVASESSKRAKAKPVKREPEPVKHEPQPVKAEPVKTQHEHTPPPTPISVAAPVVIPESPTREQEQPPMSKKTSKKSGAKAVDEQPRTSKKAAAKSKPAETPKTSKKVGKKAGKKPAKAAKPKAAETPKAETPKTSKKAGKRTSKKAETPTVAAVAPLPKPSTGKAAAACKSDDTCPPELESWRRRIRPGDRVSFRKNSRVAAALGISSERVFEVRCVVCDNGKRYVVLNLAGDHDVKIPAGQFSIVERRPEMPADIQACVAKLEKLGGPIRKSTRAIVEHFARSM